LSLERVLKTLEGFGLSRVESEVYVYLAKSGPTKAKDLSSQLGITKQHLFATLSSLRKTGIVTKKSEHESLFSALAFEELLDLLLKLNTEKVKTIKETKEELINSWKNMTEQNNN
jgi:sugar-specific transcriptional regulator TrmB